MNYTPLIKKFNDYIHNGDVVKSGLDIEYIITYDTCSHKYVLFDPNSSVVWHSDAEDAP